LRNCRIDYDQAFVNTLRFPQTWSYKKFDSAVMEDTSPLRQNPTKQAICSEVCGGDKGKYRKFESELRCINAGIRRITDSLLAGYGVRQKAIVWRHTETRLENLHVDIDQDSENIESVRLYFNMDDVPRIWHTTHPFSRLMRHYYRALDLAAFADQPLEQLLKSVSLRLFGTWRTRGRERFPHHVAMFEPGDFWLSDGRTVPHQVVYGRRTVSTFYRLDQSRLPPWHPSLVERVRALHGALRAADDLGESASLAGVPEPYGPAGPPLPPTTRKVSLKADWERHALESVQPTLVRL
ncbi:MAG TPA: hypothetical protein VHP33_29195, partial [Polyangiaceae bacterium]|nr:hypothetical protein [Polyangiaceae bacterium]